MGEGVVGEGMLHLYIYIPTADSLRSVFTFDSDWVLYTVTNIALTYTSSVVLLTRSTALDNIRSQSRVRYFIARGFGGKKITQGLDRFRLESCLHDAIKNLAYGEFFSIRDLVSEENQQDMLPVQL